MAADRSTGSTSRALRMLPGMAGFGQASTEAAPGIAAPGPDGLGCRAAYQFHPSVATTERPGLEKKSMRESSAERPRTLPHSK